MKYSEGLGVTLLRSNTHDLAIRAYYPRIVLDVLVPHAHSEVDQHVLARGVGDDLCQDLP